MRTDPWLVPPEQRPKCPLNDQPCTSWTCLVDVCVDAKTATRDRVEVEQDLVREILVAVCERDSLSLDSEADPGTPARNYELALRLGIGKVFGLGGDENGAESD